MRTASRPFVVIVCAALFAGTASPAMAGGDFDDQLKRGAVRLGVDLLRVGVQDWKDGQNHARRKDTRNQRHRHRVGYLQARYEVDDAHDRREQSQLMRRRHDDAYEAKDEAEAAIIEAKVQKRLQEIKRNGRRPSDATRYRKPPKKRSSRQQYDRDRQRPERRSNNRVRSAPERRSQSEEGGQADRRRSDRSRSHANREPKKVTKTQRMIRSIRRAQQRSDGGDASRRGRDDRSAEPKESADQNVDLDRAAGRAH